MYHVRRASTKGLLTYLGLGRFPGWKKVREMRVTRREQPTAPTANLTLDPDGCADGRLVGTVTLDHS